MKRFLFTLTAAGLGFFSSLAQTTAKEWYDKGISLKKTEKYKDAIDAFKKAASLQANYAAALHQLGWCYNEEEKFTEAIDALQKEVKAGTTDKASNSFEMGYAYKGLKKYDEALTWLNKAIEEEEDYALAFKERGNTWYKKAEYKKALDDFNKYEELEDDIDDAVYFYNKGWCENELDKHSDAVKSLKKCVELDDEYVDAFSELGYSYYELNLNDDAITNYRIAIALGDGKDYHPILGMADVYYDNLKNYDSAMLYYEKGTQLQKKKQDSLLPAWLVL